MNPSSKKHVVLFSGPNFLALSLTEYLISKNFIVHIFSTHKSSWIKATDHIAQKGRFIIESNFSNVSFAKDSYSICVEGYDDNLKSKFIVDPLIKTIILAPFEKYDDLSPVIPRGNNIAVVYLGDLIGPRININAKLLINKVLKEIVQERNFEVAVGELFYPVYIQDVVKLVFSYMFSFGPYGKNILLLGEETSSQKLWKINSAFFKTLNFKLNTKDVDRKLPRGIERKEVVSNLSNAFSITYKWLLSTQDKTDRPKVVNKKQNKIILLITVFLLSLALLPIVTFGLSAGFYYSAYKNFSDKKILATKPFLLVSKESSRFLSFIPLVGNLYKEIQFASDIGLTGGNMLVAGYPLVTRLSELPTKILGNDIYNPADILTGSEIELSSVNDYFTNLDGIVRGDYYSKTRGYEYLKQNVDLVKVKSLLGEANNILSNLGGVLGVPAPKKYLILFQNNMELRPTGGFIGSYGLASFENGRLTEMNVSDVYSADGQLKGHVEPPAPIRTYLNEANWYLRDSNWDPDFPTSAKRAEWFLDKEIGESVDGVIAIDLSPIKDMLDITGPIFLSDYNMDITSQNLYEKTQQEVESNFFAGSRKKASFLTALSRSLLSEFAHMDTKDKVKLLSVLFNNLEKRHIQIYLHDVKFQKSIAQLNWDGSIKIPACQGECYSDIAGVVEANLGVNKVNQFITRKINAQVTFDDEYIYRKLILTINNSANISLGPSGRYKVYVRVVNLSDVDSEVEGKWVEVLPGSTQDVVFDWRSKKPSNFDIQKYKFYYRVQAGIDDFPFSLTVNDKFIYNDVLGKDLIVDYTK